MIKIEPRRVEPRDRGFTTYVRGGRQDEATPPWSSAIPIDAGFEGLAVGTESYYFEMIILLTGRLPTRRYCGGVCPFQDQ